MTGQQIRRLHLKFYILFPVSQAVTPLGTKSTRPKKLPKTLLHKRVS